MPEQAKRHVFRDAAVGYVASMPVLITTFPDGGTLEFDHGQFDGWCVFLTRPGDQRYAPSDVEYFAAAVRLAKRHGAERLYRDFTAIYERTGQSIDHHLIAEIRTMASAYGRDSLLVEIILAMLYAGMVAEENKRHAPLGKRIKRLGVHQILRLQMPVEEAAAYSRHKSWRALATECTAYGF